MGGSRVRWVCVRCKALQPDVRNTVIIYRKHGNSHEVMSVGLCRQCVEEVGRVNAYSETVRLVRELGDEVWDIACGKVRGRHGKGEAREVDDAKD